MAPMAIINSEKAALWPNRRRARARHQENEAKQRARRETRHLQLDDAASARLLLPRTRSSMMLPARVAQAAAPGVEVAAW